MDIKVARQLVQLDDVFEKLEGLLDVVRKKPDYLPEFDVDLIELFAQDNENPVHIFNKIVEDKLSARMQGIVDEINKLRQTAQEKMYETLSRSMPPRTTFPNLPLGSISNKNFDWDSEIEEALLGQIPAAVARPPVSQEEPVVENSDVDCDFYYFKPSGKWKYEGEGRFPRPPAPDTYYEVNHDAVFAENGKMPGISGNGKDYTLVIIPRPHCAVTTAYPRMIKAPNC